jgi:signal transduction histidine kinase
MRPSDAGQGIGEQAGFRGRIDHRLTLVFAAIFALVVLAGGGSSYLLGALLLDSSTIARQSEQLAVIERAHGRVQELAAAVRLAGAQGQPIPATWATRHAGELESLVRRYAAAGATTGDVEALREAVAAIVRLAREAPPSTGPAASETGVLEGIEQRIEALIEHASAAHEETERRHLQEGHRRLALAIGVNVALVVLGVALSLTAHRYVARRISAPLRRLAARARAIAGGDRGGAIAVASDDEIGAVAQAFNRMARDLDAHEERLKRMVALEERQRLARELHDSLAQDLAFVRLKLAEAERRLDGGTVEATRAAVREMLAVVDRAAQDLREAILGLHALDGQTRLMAGLAAYLESFGRLRGLPITVHVADVDRVTLDATAELQVVRIVHEALSNVARHAGASRATVSVAAEGDALRVTVEDDGKGFALENALDDRLHFGLRGMIERAAAAGGALSIESRPGGGTRVILRMPGRRA